MLLRLRRRLHVVMRIKVERFDRRVDIAGGKRRFGFLRTDRRIANAEISEPHIGQPFAGGARARCQTDNRVVAVTACQLGEADACGLLSAAGIRTAVIISCGRRAVSNRPLKKASAFTLRFPFAPAISISPPSANRQAGNSAAGSAKAIEPPKLPRLRMPDGRYAASQAQSAVRALRPRPDISTCAWRAQRTDLDKFAFLGDAVEALDAIDVDQQAGAERRMLSVAIRLCPRRRAAAHHPCAWQGA